METLDVHFDKILYMYYDTLLLFSGACEETQTCTGASAKIVPCKLLTGTLGGGWKKNLCRCVNVSFK